MYSTVLSGALIGVQAYFVTVEVDIAQGLPGVSMVGSLSCEVRESRERVMVALKNAGLHLPPNHITVNLSPADRRKEGTAFDLPIAVGILQCLQYFPKEAVSDTLFLGELGLNGEVKSVRGVLPIVREAAARGIKQCIVPAENAKEGAVIPGIVVRGVKNISELLSFLQKNGDEEEKELLLPRSQVDAESLFHVGNRSFSEDFSEVTGQEAAKRAAEIAAAGFHNLMLVGPPGVGKSMIARRIPGILPLLTLEESLEVTSIASIAGALPEESALITVRPFQSPHHTISLPALIGGSSNPKPGMISLAHRGVLFLDELPEFQRIVLDSLRQPLEERRVHVNRMNGNVTFPSDFMLVCAMNPCPCGYYPDTNRCNCTQAQVKRYLGKVSGPILDRIDLCVELQPVQLSDMQKGARKVEKSGKGRKVQESKSPEGKLYPQSESSSDIRKRVEQARQIQERRFAESNCRFNADISAKDMEKYCRLGKKEQALLEELYASLNLSVRAYHRILRVARTIADLDGAEEIGEKHLLEASFYRPSQEYWR